MSTSFTVNLENVTLSSTTEILTYIQLTYGIPSFFMMIFTLFLIAFGKVYKSSFYTLVIFDLSTNICVYLNTWIAIRIEMHPNLVFLLKAVEYTIPGSLTWFKYFPYWFFHMHFWTSALLTVHRLSSIFLFHRYESFWSRWYFILLIFAIACICSHLPKYLWTGFLYEVYIIDDVFICIHFPLALKAAYNVVAVFSVIYFLLNLSMGLITAFMVSKKFQGGSTLNASISRKLTKISLTYSVVYTSEVMWSVLNSCNSYLNFLPDFFLKFNNMLLVFASDIFTLSLPFILLIYDSNVKSDLFRITKQSAPGTLLVLTN
ncbi:Serpentine receptor class gamma [Caenorhabditis elegans]|uniref:Serpentine receptor class gamma n=1 Tax=Caenorhabditis elegans TaxID=6239 RepID=O62517_CAEEL|nr:Serpentine receptor class gamma [Caenorhabditis elegans]CAB01907.2 Serpentine receptor class gamma [Caenorhabditis elegans]|eukprot:NP_510589.2 Serpentine receptor class gamma [Caenorhabditis elegans]